MSAKSPGDQAVDPAVELEQQLALEDVQRLLEGVDVAREPAARREAPSASSVCTAPCAGPTSTSGASP